jgi:hypothetical protein
MSYVLQRVERMALYIHEGNATGCCLTCRTYGILHKGTATGCCLTCITYGILHTRGKCYRLHVIQQPVAVPLCRMPYVLHFRQQPVAVPFEQQFPLSDFWLSVTNQNVRPER